MKKRLLLVTHGYPFGESERGFLGEEAKVLADQFDLVIMDEASQVADLIKYALIVVTTAPIMVVYPFLQKYFVKGVMIGAIKG